MFQELRCCHELIVTQSLAPTHGPEGQDRIGVTMQWFKQSLGGQGGFQSGPEDQIRGITQVWKGLPKERLVAITLVPDRLLVVQGVGGEQGGKA
jgi:hypothetical protein